MTEQRVQIALPIDTVHQAWSRYVGYGGFENQGETLTWTADDGSGISAEFASEAPEVTTIVANRVVPSDPNAPEADLSAFMSGFVSYVNSAFAELHKEQGDESGRELSGPDGTSHIEELPRRLGTDHAADPSDS